MGLVSIKYLEQQNKHSTKNTVATIIITSNIIKHFREDEAWEETGTTHRPAQELWGMNKLVAGRPQNMPAAGSALMVGALTSVGVGAGVQSSGTPFPPAPGGGGGLWKAPSSWLGCIRRCRDALYSDTTTQGKEGRVGGRNRME